MKRMLMAVFSVALGVSAGAEAAEVFEQTDLFEANSGGYAHYRIPGIVETAKGTLLAYAEARKHERSDWGTIDLVMRRSEDGGKTWEPARKIAEPPKDARRNPVAEAQKLGREGEITLNNPVMVAEPSGAVHLLYCVEYGRCFVRHSEDDGRTFSKPEEITGAFEAIRPRYDWKVLATGPGHGICLENGRLLVPVWLSTGTGGHAHRPSAVSTIVSDDHGRTWRIGELVVEDPEPRNPSETTAVELKDGRVMVNIRHESAPHFRGVSVSADGVSGWSPMRYDRALPEPICFGSLVRYARGGEKGPILFVNPRNPEGRERKNLTVHLSEDEGGTWSAMRTIDAGTSGYADLAVSRDGTIFCFYEHGTAGAGATNPESLRLARFNLEWVREGSR